MQSIKRASDILDCFNNSNNEMSLKDICDKVDLKKSTVFGIIKTLEECSYIIQDPHTNKYKLGLKFIEKSRIVSESMDIKAIALPYIKTLTNKFKETSHLCLYEQNYVYCVANIQSDEGFLFMSSREGNKLPIYASASGKAILSNFSDEKIAEILNKTELKKLTEYTTTDIKKIKEDLKDIRKNFYSLEDEETEIGAYSIAAPIKNYNNQVAGAISMTGPKTRMQEKKLYIIDALLSASLSISKELGYDNIE
ncbi:hypothetical protein AGR56_00005 [Clostridium sp. DMHC 10]|uniref:IclR family transcriptional regulator n=1 Tax=Clostridium sp. DMHC 10 TaxID=747377 RepID=UPI00069F03AF|nr:hypothetical protein AGR56_00005 [Clostridium sp. DMHC 10]